MAPIFYKQDFIRNKKNTKGLLFVICFRVCNFFSRNIFLKIIGIPFRILYVFFIQWGMGIDVIASTSIGKGLVVFHGQGLIVNGDTVIGDNVTLRHNTTIGNAREGSKCPVIENNVDIGANCVVIGNITIGANSVVGAGSVVVKSIPPNSVVVGNPAKVIKTV